MNVGPCQIAKNRALVDDRNYGVCDCFVSILCPCCIGTCTRRNIRDKYSIVVCGLFVEINCIDRMAFPFILKLDHLGICIDRWLYLLFLPSLCSQPETRELTSHGAGATLLYDSNFIL